MLEQVLNILIFELENIIRKKGAIAITVIFFLYFYIFSNSIGNLRVVFGYTNFYLIYSLIIMFINFMPFLIMFTSGGIFSSEFEKRINLLYILVSRKKLFLGKILAHIFYNSLVVLLTLTWSYLVAARYVIYLETYWYLVLALLLNVIFLVLFATILSILTKKTLFSITSFFIIYYIILTYIYNLISKIYDINLWFLPNKLINEIVSLIMYTDLTQVPKYFLLLIIYSISLTAITMAIHNKIDIKS